MKKFSIKNKVTPSEKVTFDSLKRMDSFSFPEGMEKDIQTRMNRVNRAPARKKYPDTESMRLQSMCARVKSWGLSEEQLKEASVIIDRDWTFPPYRIGNRERNRVAGGDIGAQESVIERLSEVVGFLLNDYESTALINALVTLDFKWFAKK